MNFLKKNYKNILYIGLSVIAVIITIILIIPRSNNKLEILTITSDYYIVNDNLENKVNIPVYINDHKSSLMKKALIDKVKITSSFNNESYLVDVKQINEGKETYYHDLKYFEYDIELDIPLEFKDLVILKDTYLNIFYQSGDSLNLPIGNMCFYNYKKDHNQAIRVTHLKGITKKFEDKLMLEAVMIKLSNTNNLVIKDIIPISNVATVNLTESKAIDYVDEVTTPIDKFINKDYQIIGKSEKVKDLTLKSSQSLLLYLNYNSYLESTQIGFIIKYEDEGMIKEKVIAPFKYYQVSKFDITRIKHTLYERD